MSVFFAELGVLCIIAGLQQRLMCEHVAISAQILAQCAWWRWEKGAGRVLLGVGWF